MFKRVLPSKFVEWEPEKNDGNQQKTRLEASKPPTVFTTALKPTVNNARKYFQELHIFGVFRFAKKTKLFVKDGIRYISSVFPGTFFCMRSPYWSN